MKTIAFSLVVVFFVVVTTFAQRPEDRQGPPGGPPRGFRTPPGFHLMTALDADKNGKISSKEIENAIAALQKLDKNKDGKLSGEEIGWPPAGGFRGGRGRGGFPGFGGPGGGPGPERPQRPESEGPNSTAGKQPPTGGATKARFFSVEQLQSLDRDNDGKITKKEIPTGLQERILNRVDTNKDGVIDKAELTELGESQVGNRKPL